MTYTHQQRAVVEALGLSPDDLRWLAADLARGEHGATVGDLASEALARMSEHHRYAKSLRRMIAWAGDTDARTIGPGDVAAWADGGAEQLADALPGDPFGAGGGDGVDDLALAAGSGEGGAFEQVLLDRALVARLGFVVLEPLCEFVGVVKDLLD